MSFNPGENLYVNNDDKRDGQPPYSSQPQPTLNPLPLPLPVQMLSTQSDLPVYPGQLGPIAVFNPVPPYRIHIPVSAPLAVSSQVPRVATEHSKLNGKEKEKPNEKGTKDFEYQFTLNTMDPKKEDETVFFVDSKSRPPEEVLHEILSRMEVDLAAHRIGYRLSDEKESIWTRINNIEDFTRAMEAQREIQSRAYKTKKLRIINKDAVRKEVRVVAIKKRSTATAATTASARHVIYEELCKKLWCNGCFKHCYRHPDVEFRHLHLDKEAIAVWAKAMTDGVKGVSFTQPPNSHLFSALLLKHQKNDHHTRKRSRSANTPPLSSIPAKRWKPLVPCTPEKTQPFILDLSPTPVKQVSTSKVPVVLVPRTPEKIQPSFLDRSLTPIKHASTLAALTSQFRSIPQTPKNLRIQKWRLATCINLPTSISVIEISSDSGSSDVQVDSESRLGFDDVHSEE